MSEYSHCSHAAQRLFLIKELSKLHILSLLSLTPCFDINVLVVVAHFGVVVVVSAAPHLLYASLFL